MYKLKFLFASISLLLLIACNNSPQPSKVDNAATPSNEMQNAPVLTESVPDSLTPKVNPVSTTPPQTTNNAGINPAHGQPGHRCDIPVGAPLNSPPGKTPAAPAAQQQKNPPVATQQGTNPVQPAPSTTTTQTTTQTAPGMNPPHGQPGHRCDIAVGAPLSSAPIKK
jgi:hypothetical protein